jgi:hypothetical protein
VAEYVEAQKRAGVRERLDAIYAAEESALDPVLEKIQALSLPKKAWRRRPIDSCDGVHRPRTGGWRRHPG